MTGRWLVNPQTGWILDFADIAAAWQPIFALPDPHQAARRRRRGAHADRQDDYRQRAMDREVPEHTHGTTTGYQFYYCRCERCRAAKSVENARRRRNS